MFRNVYYDTRKSKICLWDQVRGKNVYTSINWVPYVYELADDGDIKTIEGETAKKITFNTYNEYYVYAKEHPNCKENLLRPEIQFLAEYYHKIPDDEVENPNLKVYSLDIEVCADKAFPKATEAKDPVSLISVYDMMNKTTISFGIKPYDGKYLNEPWFTFVHCKDEEMLLRQFFGWMHKNPCDVITGWNCIPLTNYIFKSNEIAQLSSIIPGDMLSLSNEVDIVYPRSKKLVRRIKLGNGSSIETSGDHIIPIRYINKNSYTKLIKNDKSNNHIYDVDMKVDDIPFEEQSCFVHVPFDLNVNKCNDIDNNLLYLAGLIYTDGSLRNKSCIYDEYRIYESNTELLNKIPYITTKICGNRDHGFYRNVKHSIVKPVHNLIYDEQGNKALNISMLSRLSKKQFYYFLSGLLDGDGIASSTGMSYCDYTKDGIDKLYNLCLWNGIFITRSKNIMHFIEYDFNSLHLNHPYRWKSMKKSSLNRNSSQKASKIRFKKIDNEYYIRITDIEETDKEVEMGDIKTKTGYFISNGVNVHNCMTFDLQYLINRIERITGDEGSYALLSPIKNVRTWKPKDGDDVNIDIAGVTILDYLDIYKWYSPKKLERYTLDYVSIFELKKGKVDYSVYNDLRQLYHDDWNLYVEYNVIDSLRVGQLEEKLGYIKLVQTLSLLTKVPMKYYHIQTALIEGMFITYFRRNGMCAPTFYGGTQESYEAAYVKSPILGMHNWVIDLDITSSYPTAIITLNMSNETYYGRILGMTEDQVMSYSRNKNFPEFQMMKNIGKMEFSNKRLDLFNNALKKKLLCITPCGSVFITNPLGVIATVEKNTFHKRIEVKKKMIKLKKSLPDLRGKMLEDTKEKIARYNSLQNALKIILNATYGVLATPYFRYFNINIAEAIVSCGRQTIKAGESIVNNLLNNPNDELKEILKNIKE